MRTLLSSVPPSSAWPLDFQQACVPRNRPHWGGTRGQALQDVTIRADDMWSQSDFLPSEIPPLAMEGDSRGH